MGCKGRRERVASRGAGQVVAAEVEHKGVSWPFIARGLLGQTLLSQWFSPTWAKARRVTTLPERDLSAIRGAWRGMDDSQHHPLILTARTGRPSKMNRPASMPLVRAVDQSRCKPTWACGWSGGSRRIGGMS